MRSTRARRPSAGVRRAGGRRGVVIMTLYTRLCDLFGVQYPILNAPMGGGDAPGRLAAAVSQAGGLGLIGGTTVRGVDWVVERIRIARASTDRPFGIGFISHLPNAAELMRAALDEG